MPEAVESADSVEQYIAAQEYSIEQAYTLAETHIYTEECIDEELSARPELTRLRKDVRRREFDVVLIYSYECLAREQALITSLIVELEQHGIRIESVKGAI